MDKQYTAMLWLLHFVLLLSNRVCLCETILDQIYEMKMSLYGRTCKLEHVNISCVAHSELNCVYHCSRQLRSVAIVHNSESGICKCCSKVYTIQDVLPAEVGTAYYTTAQDVFVYRDCVDAKDSGVTTSGVQRVRTPITNTTIVVYCDMETRDGGWLVFQNRFDGSVDFYRNFSDYEQGFGDVRGEYWLGLKYLYEFTRGVPSLLYIKFVDANDTSAYEFFEGFEIKPGPEYGFGIGDFLEANDGTTPPSYIKSFATSRNNGFSAADVDRDIEHNFSCSEKHFGGWWFRSCANIFPNSRYLEPGTKGDKTSIYHNTWRGVEALKATRLMIKRP